MAARRHPARERISEWISLYEQGVGISTISERAGASKASIRRWLLDAGIELREFHSTAATQARWVDAYRSGTSIANIADRERRDPNTIRAAIARAGVQLRSTTPRIPTPADNTSIVEMYDAGSTIADIHAATGWWPTTIRGALIDAGRNPKRAARALTDRDKAEIVERYLAGEGSTTIAAAYGISPNWVLGHLDANLIDTRNPPTPHDVAERHAAVDDYLAGDSFQVVAERYDAAPSAIRLWVLEAGHEPRPPPGGRRHNDQFRAQVVADALDTSDSYRAVAQRHGISPATVRSWLIEAGHRGRRSP